MIAAAVGIAYGSAKLFGVSFALGAFFAGMVMRESTLSHRAAEESLPLRDAFAVLFFVSVGMLFEPAVLRRAAAGSSPSWSRSSCSARRSPRSLLVLAFRYPLNTALTVSASLAQIGEFSFILAGARASRSACCPWRGSSLIARRRADLDRAQSVRLQGDRSGCNAGSARARRWRASWSGATIRSAELPATIDPRHLAGQVVLVGYGRVGTAHRARRSPRRRRSLRRRRAATARSSRSCASRACPRYPAMRPSPTCWSRRMSRARACWSIATPDTLGVRQMIEIARALNPAVEIAGAYPQRRRGQAPDAGKRRQGFPWRVRARAGHGAVRAGVPGRAFDSRRRRPPPSANNGRLSSSIGIINWTRSAIDAQNRDLAAVVTPSQSCSFLPRFPQTDRAATREESRDETAERHQDPRQPQGRVRRRIAGEPPLPVFRKQGRRRRPERRRRRCSARPPKARPATRTATSTTSQRSAIRRPTCRSARAART